MSKEYNFDGMQEFEVFQQLTTMEELFRRNAKINPELHKGKIAPEELPQMFKAALQYVKDNGFDELYEEYLSIKSTGIRRSVSIMNVYDNFVFNHPLVTLVALFIELGFLTKELQINVDRPQIKLGDNVLSFDEAKKSALAEGVILKDGTLIPIKSIQGHRLGALWVYLNNLDYQSAIRHTNDCISTDPIFSSLSDYIVMPDEMYISQPQAKAMYNIHLANSRGKTTFKSVLENSRDIAIVPGANRRIRNYNAGILESALGEEIFNKATTLNELRSDDYLF